MKAFRIIMTVALISLFCFSSAWAQTPDVPDPVLEDGDVKQFIKTYPQLKKDLDEYGVQMDMEGGEMSYDEALKANQEFLELLKKHGWDENFWIKSQTILMGVVILSSEEGVQESNPQFEATKKQIESNPALSEAMKKELLEKLMAAQTAMGAQKQALQQSINPLDMAKIKPHMEELKEILE
jgi:hypothetical protein